jgi:ABC-type Fe3+ transport system permease subunit
MNTLTITHSQSIFGLFSIPVLNTDFFFTGIPRLVKWDYSFFGGNAALFQYFLYSLTFALAFALFIIIIGVVSNFFARR